MKKFINHIRAFLKEAFLIGENGMPSIALYFFIFFIILIILFVVVIITNNTKYQEFAISAGIGLLVSLAATYLYDYSRYDCERDLKNKVLKTLSRKFRLSSRLLILHISQITNSSEANPTSNRIIQEYCSDCYDDSNFEKSKDVRSALFDFIDDAKLFITLERGLIEANHLEQLFQIQISYRDYLSRYEDLKNIEMESEQNKSRYKEFLLSLRSFLWMNQKIFDKGGLLEDIGAKTISQLKDYDQIYF